MNSPKILIVGAGHAGGAVAAFLRQFGCSGEIVLAGEETAPPYQRPPLSKAWLKGETDLESLLLRPKAFYAEQAIDLRTGVTATRINRTDKIVSFFGGCEETYDILILATGSTPRKLSIPGADRPELIELRTLGDAERLKTALGAGRRLAVVGGGYVGLEAAASARALGAEVIVIERMDRVLQRVASPILSTFFTDLHTAHGVELVCNAEVAAFEVGALCLKSGQRIEADTILVGVGAVACDDLARTANLACDDGVVVDADARTSDPSIFAIGDMTRRVLPTVGERTIRLESVPNALEQAKQAASAIMGRPAPAAEVPWFWSDQYDVKLQIAGLPLKADIQVLRGDPATGRFAVFHLAQGDGHRVVCVEAVNAPPEFMAGRQLIARKTRVDLHRLADDTISMKAMLSTSPN